MFSIYLASSTSFDGIWLLLALAIAGGASGLLSGRGRRLLIALLVVGALVYAGVMVAIYLASSTSFDGIWLLLALAIAGVASGLLSGRARRLLIALLVVGALVYATSAMAAPYPLPCDPLWRLLGWC